MTTVGKILVFLNLVFSFVVGTFAVMAFTARTHWATKYDELATRYQVAQADSKTFKDEADRLTRERNAFNQRLYSVGKADLKLKDVKGPPEAVDQAAADAANRVAGELRARQTRIDDLEKKLGDVTADLSKANRQIKSYAAATSTSQKTSELRQNDVEKIREMYSAEIKRNNDLVKSANDMRDQMVAAQITATSLRDTNKRLEEQLQDMARDLVRVRAVGAPGARGARRDVNPPPEDVEGLVARSEGRLVTITIGSDAGLAKGQTLEVFRFGATPRYIVRIKIVDLSPTQAVGEVVGRLTTPIRKNDTVGSSIMGRR